MLKIENCPSGITGNPKAVGLLKNNISWKSVTK
jgi:hypothetical protein